MQDRYLQISLQGVSLAVLSIEDIHIRKTTKQWLKEFVTCSILIFVLTMGDITAECTVFVNEGKGWWQRIDFDSHFSGP